MAKNASRVLKADNVNFEGKFRLDLTNNTLNMPKNETEIPVSPSARIVESNAEFAVIEIACPCGKRIPLRCEYTS